MSGIDKANKMRELIARGWKDVSTDDDPWLLQPPDELWKNRPASLSVHDAESLEELLGPQEDVARAEDDRGRAEERQSALQAKTGRCSFLNGDGGICVDRIGHDGPHKCNYPASPLKF